MFKFNIVVYGSEMGIIFYETFGKWSIL